MIFNVLSRWIAGVKDIKPLQQKLHSFPFPMVLGIHEHKSYSIRIRPHLPQSLSPFH